jgi:hypothetical protein
MRARHLTHATTYAAALAALLGGALVQACGDDGGDLTDPGSAAILRTVINLSGDVDPHIPEFGAAIGAVDNKSETGLHAATGRREINWDGVPTPFLNSDTFPAAFFNVNAPRGAIYEAEGGTGLRVSDNNFGDVNPSYATELIPFSDPKMFAPIGTNRFELRFRIPGTDTAAVVQSFGAVIVDVDKANVSRLQAYDKDDRLIADVPAATRKDPDEYTLVGVRFDRPAIARVVLTLGDTPIGAGIDDVTQGGTKDVVVLDDLLYSEPQPIQ